MNIQELKEVGCVTKNSIINADCLDALKYVKGGSIDMIFCDLPYG